MILETMQKELNQIKILNQFTEKIPTDKGLRQGDGLTPIPFNLTFEKEIRDKGLKLTLPF